MHGILRPRHALHVITPSDVGACRIRPASRNACRQRARKSRRYPLKVLLLVRESVPHLIHATLDTDKTDCASNGSAIFAQLAVLTYAARTIGVSRYTCYLPCPFVRLSCRSPNSTSTTRTTCCRHVSDTPDHLDMSRWSESRQHPRTILVTRQTHTRNHRNICSHKVMRKRLPYNLAVKAGIPREQFPRSILVRHVRRGRFPRDTLAPSLRGCHDDAARKLLPRNLSSTAQQTSVDVQRKRSSHGGCP